MKREVYARCRNRRPATGDGAALRLQSADLPNAYLRQANLQEVRKNFAQGQLNEACGDEHTKLPPSLTIPHCADEPGQ